MADKILANTGLLIELLTVFMARNGIKFLSISEAEASAAINYVLYEQRGEDGRRGVMIQHKDE